MEEKKVQRRERKVKPRLPVQVVDVLDRALCSPEPATHRVTSCLVSDSSSAGIRRQSQVLGTEI